MWNEKIYSHRLLWFFWFWQNMASRQVHQNMVTWKIIVSESNWPYSFSNATKYTRCAYGRVLTWQHKQFSQCDIQCHFDGINISILFIIVFGRFCYRFNYKCDSTTQIVPGMLLSLVYLLSTEIKMMFTLLWLTINEKKNQIKAAQGSYQYCLICTKLVIALFDSLTFFSL